MHTDREKLEFIIHNKQYHIRQNFNGKWVSMITSNGLGFITEVEGLDSMDEAIESTMKYHNDKEAKNV